MILPRPSSISISSVIHFVTDSLSIIFVPSIDLVEAKKNKKQIELQQLLLDGKLLLLNEVE